MVTAFVPGSLVTPLPEEIGYKDTILAPPGTVTRVVATFDIPGTYVWHCHILSHEEHDMMRPLVITTPATSITLNGFQTSAANRCNDGAGHPDGPGIHRRCRLSAGTRLRVRLHGNRSGQRADCEPAAADPGNATIQQFHGRYLQHGQRGQLDTANNRRRLHDHRKDQSNGSGRMQAIQSKPPPLTTPWQRSGAITTTLSKTWCYPTWQHRWPFLTGQFTPPV